MSTFKVKVKWGKELYDVDIDTSEPPMVFKAQLFALTGVQPDRQKVMIKGMTLKDDDWGSMKLKNGLSILLMGSREEIPKEPVQRPIFMEDLTESELATALELPAGLANLGNTCYMNATIQCLRVVPELRKALQRFQGRLAVSSGGVMPAQSITSALRDLYLEMDKTGSSIPPVILLQVLHLAFPRFAEKSEHGGLMQQDANECWTEVMRMLQQKLSPFYDPEVRETPSLEGASAPKYSSLVDQYFGGQFDVSLKCIESEDEPLKSSQENFLQLSCFISTDVKFLHGGLKSRMQETITKLSPTLNRDAQYLKTSKISRLPAYLTVQFVRFFYKEKEAVNAKILKDIKFPLELDMFELCSEELQNKLNPMRSRFKEEDDKKAAEAQLKLEQKKIDIVDVPNVPTKALPFSFEDDAGSNNSGYYQLRAVLTHKGRSSSSGHYVAWVHKENDEWYKCDDDKVSVITSEDILRLSGGGDWHCAYVLLYGPKKLEIAESGDVVEKMDLSAT